MKFKTELHVHTSDVSKCSHISTEELIESYIRKGYSTLVITNHYSKHTFSHIENVSWQEKNDLYLSAYKKAKDISNGRINVLLGMEYRNIYSSNDYLVYGMTEEFIRTHSFDDEHNLLSMHLKEFIKLAHDNNMLVFQAHPFRDGMKIIKPSYLDGIEILNGHPGHNSRNDIAKLWAKKYKLLACGGSDCHEIGEEARVALLTKFVVSDNEQLIDVLKSSPVIKSVGEKQ